MLHTDNQIIRFNPMDWKNPFINLMAGRDSQLFVLRHFHPDAFPGPAEFPKRKP